MPRVCAYVCVCVIPQVVVPDQKLPVSFTVCAHVTTTDLIFSPRELNFGPCVLAEDTGVVLRVTNPSALPQTFGFVNLPSAIHITPNDGFGHILPGEHPLLMPTTCVCVGGYGCACACVCVCVVCVCVMDLDTCCLVSPLYKGYFVCVCVCVCVCVWALCEPMFAFPRTCVRPACVCVPICAFVTRQAASANMCVCMCVCVCVCACVSVSITQARRSSVSCPSSPLSQVPSP